MSESAAATAPAEMRTGVVTPPIRPSGLVAFALVLAVTGALLLGLVVSILRLNHGTFIYSMDDPYIGLALSDQIRHGNYGMNTGLHAAPASSILYPLLLAPASGTRIHPYLPFIINCFALFATLVIIWRLFVYLHLVQDRFGVIAQAVALLLLALSANLIGVVFTGLEHNLHIAAVAACIYGMALFLDKNEMPVWLPAVIVLAPLLRFEGLALSLAAILVLALRGRLRTAAGAFALIVLFVGCFSAFLVSQGLPPLPSSILTKSAVAANGISGAGTGFFHSAAQNVVKMSLIPVGTVLLVIGVAAAARCFHELPAWPWRWTSQGLMALLLVCLIGAHAVAGRFGWLHRYEDYLLLGTALMGICLLREQIRSLMLNKELRLVSLCGAAIALSVICKPYFHETLQVPLAANNIYEQQFQMHRFVNNFYRAPVAVNDLGLVSYHNPNFVLDLGGLASEEARILRTNGGNAADYEALVGGHHVHLVMVYDKWFEGQIPISWVKVATLTLSRKLVSPAGSDVQFYATDAPIATLLQPELESFRKSLPPGVKLTIYSRGADAASQRLNGGGF
jgi:hypothetical protein